MLTSYDQKRIEALRLDALQPTIPLLERDLLFFRQYARNSHIKTEELRYADAYRHTLQNTALSIDPGEMIVGKFTYLLTPEEEKELEALRPLIDDFTSKGGQNSHMAVDYDRILDLGVVGVLALIDEKQKNPLTDEQKNFYEGCKGCLLAIAEYADRYADLAAEMAKAEADSIRKEELEQLARICHRVPRYPAETFHEAVQSVHFLTHCLTFDPIFRWHMQFQLGRPDRYLWKFYQKDLQEGRLTKEKAQMLLDCLAIQINQRVPHGLSSGYMVGGRDGNGEIVANDLTEMCMQVIDDVRLVYPSVGLCYTQGMEDRYLQKACEILSHGRSHPAIFNDDIISEGLMRYGVPEADSHKYIHSTCVEITPEAASNVWVASPYHNLVQCLLESMDREYTSSEELLAEILSNLEKKIEREFLAENHNRIQRMKHQRNPLLSCFVQDCLERGLDIEQGGARYNWIMPSFVGMSNLVDSLAAIDQLVFREKKYTMAQYKAMIDANFERYESQRLEILNRVPKYGNDQDFADGWCNRITDFIVETCKKFTPIHSNGRLIPSVFCWIMHATLGNNTGATPDGRKAGFPLGDGSGPAQGREKEGPTASILSSTKWDHRNFIGGVAVNMKFSKKVFTADSYQKMLALIKTYLQRGGFEIQINVVDRDTLLDAREHPELHRDLVVRIGGYSDYFVKLSDSMQEEVLLRTEHEI